MNRRGFLGRLLAAVAVPASVLLPKAIGTRAKLEVVDEDFTPAWYSWRFGSGWEDLPDGCFGLQWQEGLTAITRKAFVPRMVTQIYDTTPLLRQLMKNKYL